MGRTGLRLVSSFLSLLYSLQALAAIRTDQKPPIDNNPTQHAETVEGKKKVGDTLVKR